MTNFKTLAEAFLAGVAQGEVASALVHPEMTAWTLTSGDTSKEKFLGGIKALAAAFAGSLGYQVRDCVIDGERLMLEATSSGTLINGEAFSNNHVFIFHFKSEQVIHVREYVNPIIVQQQLLPVLQTLM